MPPTIICRKAGSWVDRGEQANPKLRRVLAHFFERLELADEPWLEEHAQIVLGMVAADATEVPPNQATPDSLSHWLASRLLTPGELAQFEQEGKPPDSDDH